MISQADRSASGIGEVGSVVGQDDVDLVRNGFDEMTQEIAGVAPLGRLREARRRRICCPIDSDEHIELAFGGLHLGDIDMEEADRIALELRLGSLSLYLGKRLIPWRCKQRCNEERVRRGIVG